MAITEIPFGKTTTTLIESILKAQEKGKIKIRKVDNNTAQNAEILVYLQPGTSSDKTIDALYAFTDCEVSISPNCCVICDRKPQFLTVSQLLSRSTDRTVELFRSELTIKRNEISERLHFASLERIFIEERIYKDKGFEQSKNMDEAVKHIDGRLEPFKKLFIRDITRDDILKLMEIKMGRILKFNSDKADEQIAAYKEAISKIDHNLANIIDYTIDWFIHLKEKYGADYPRRTEVRGFDTIVATKVVEANEKLYINREEGFIGTSLKKDEFVCTCSDIDDIIIFYKDGKYKIVKVADKMFVGKNILYLNVFKKNDTRTIYNVIYRDGRDGLQYMKRFAVTGVSRDKEYDLTQGKPGSRITWFSANSNGEAEVLKITFKPKPRMKALYIEKSFSEIAIKGRQSMGNIVTKNEIHRISLKEKGESTLGGLKVWFDRDVLRLNYDGRGEYIGEFSGHDSILVVLKNGDFYTSNFDITNHYENDIIVFEKYEEGKVWTAVLNDASQQGYPYIKRFQMENSRKKQNFLGENPDSTLILLTDEPYARVGVTFGGGDSFREAMEVEAEEFIGVKSFKAKGKRLTTFEVEEIKELEPIRQPEEKETEEVETEKSKQPFVEIDDSDAEEISQEENLTPDENGQMHLF